MRARIREKPSPEEVDRQAQRADTIAIMAATLLPHQARSGPFDEKLSPDTRMRSAVKEACELYSLAQKEARSLPE